LNKLKTAIAFGADAVYCGIPEFSLRTRINQFDLKILRQGIEYAHKHGKKVFVTANIVAHNRHLRAFEKYFSALKKIKPDAIIVSDPGIFLLAKKIWPKAKLHLSTQANCTNWQAAKFWYDLGVSRIILGREVTLREIKEIHKKVSKVELEYFVHGAMCMSYSGRCLLSKYYTDRSANLGDCTQPCRWKYNVSNVGAEHYSAHLQEIQRPEELLKIEEDQHGSYIMNSKDLCLVEYLKELKNAGISAFKIEGRAKSFYYVGNTVKVYREIMDHGTRNIKQPFEELKKTQNRGFTTGFLFGQEKCEQNITSSHENCGWEFCGVVTTYESATNLQNATDKNQIVIKVHNKIRVGDQVEFIVPFGENFKYKIKKMFDDNMREIDSAHGGQGQVIFLPLKKKLPEYTLVRRKVGKA